MLILHPIATFTKRLKLISALSVGRGYVSTDASCPTNEAHEIYPMLNLDRMED